MSAGPGGRRKFTCWALSGSGWSGEGHTAKVSLHLHWEDLWLLHRCKDTQCDMTIVRDRMLRAF